MTDAAFDRAAEKQTSPPLPAGWPFLSIPEAHAKLTAPGERFEVEELVIRGIPTKTWKNAPSTIVEVFRTGRAYGDRTFLVFEDDRATFEAFCRASLTLAHRLQKDGVKKGDRVAIVMRNLPEWAVCFFACMLVGAIATPLNAWWTGAELEFGLADSGVTIAFVDDERLARIEDVLPRCPDLKLVYVARAPQALLSREGEKDRSRSDQDEGARFRIALDLEPIPSSQTRALIRPSATFSPSRGRRACSGGVV